MTSFDIVLVLLLWCYSGDTLKKILGFLIYKQAIAKQVSSQNVFKY